jgi:basic amino acid/polyamine antiporter, APA family
LIFYVLTIAGVIRLRKLRPHLPRPFKAPGYPIVPLIYIMGGTVVLLMLFSYRPATTWPGLLIVLLGVPVYMLMRRNA